MKNKIKDFLMKRRFKTLKNKKGFSLLEVLVGVTIIGIIAAIAVPRFANYRDSAALVAASTTGKNIAKAYNLCAATKSSCTSLANLNIACDTCKTIVHDKDAFCVDMEQEISGNTFNACVSINKADGSITQTYGGEFKLCHKKCKNKAHGGATAACGTGVDNGDDIPNSTIKRCDDADDCPDGNNTVWNQTPVCKKNAGANAGKCVSADGSCASS